MEAVKFECPHCQTVVDVEAASMGEVVTCPNPQCGMPFEAVPPEGDPVESAGEADGTAADAGETPAAGAGVESQVYRTHPAMFRNRPLSFLGLWAALLVGLAGLVASLAGTVWAPFSEAVQWYGSIVLVAGSAVALLIWWIRVIDETLTVTTERTIHRKGIFDKETTEVLHTDVTNLQVDQTLLDRMMGVGDIALSSSGQDTLEIMARGIPGPDEHVQTIRRYQTVED